MSVVVTANVYNVALTVVFVARARGAAGIERLAGLVTVGCGIPLLLASVYAAGRGDPPWAFLLPLPLAVHCGVELVVDYLRPVDFRATRWLWPYLLLFYLGQWLLIGYAFAVQRAAGFVTLATYFLSLAATVPAHRRSGRAVRPG